MAKELLKTTLKRATGFGNGSEFAIKSRCEADAIGKTANEGKATHRNGKGKGAKG